MRQIGFAGSCYARPAGAWGIPPRPVAALMLATQARYYHPRLLALTVPHLAGGRTAREPKAFPEQAAEPLLRLPTSSATPTSCMQSLAGPAYRGCTGFNNEA